MRKKRILMLISPHRILRLKARCDTRFQRAFTASCCVFNEITLVGSNLRNNLENENAMQYTNVENASRNSALVSFRHNHKNGYNARVIRCNSFY